jgi:hypothetical protein
MVLIRIFQGIRFMLQVSFQVFAVLFIATSVCVADWSILYVIIVLLVATLVGVLILWGTVCLCRR